MRILMVTEDLPAPQVGGLGKHVVTLSNHLIRIGHEVDILGRSDRDYASVRSEVGFNGRFIGGFSMKGSGWKEAQLGAFVPPKRPAQAQRIAKSVMAHSPNYHVIHYHGHLPMIGRYLPPSIPFVQSRHDQGSECVTHTRFRDGNVCNAIDPRECAKCIKPAPGQIRTLISAQAVRRYRREVAETFAQRPTIFVSDFLRKNFKRAVPTVDLERSRVIHNFIDLERIRRIADESVQIVPRSILIAARIDAAKGFGEFLRAFESKIYGDVTVEVVGDGPDREILQRRYSSERIRFCGWQPYEEVISKARRAHACVIPSICEEACSTTILEALCLGRPCITLGRGGTPELMAYQRYPGQLHLAGDMEELIAHTLEAISKNPLEFSLPMAFGADVSEIAALITNCYEDIIRSVKKF